MKKLSTKSKMRRDDALRNFASEHPNLNQTQIGASFWLSQSGVCRILHPHPRPMK